MRCAGGALLGAARCTVGESNPLYARPWRTPEVAASAAAAFVHAARLDGYRLTLVARLFEQIGRPIGLLDRAVELAPRARQVVGLPPQGAHVDGRQDPD